MCELAVPDFHLMADCWMANNVPYVVDLAYSFQEVGMNCLEEVLL